MNEFVNNLQKEANFLKSFLSKKEKEQLVNAVIDYISKKRKYSNRCVECEDCLDLDLCGKGFDFYEYIFRMKYNIFREDYECFADYIEDLNYEIKKIMQKHNIYCTRNKLSKLSDISKLKILNPASKDSIFTILESYLYLDPVKNVSNLITFLLSNSSNFNNHGL